MSDPQAPTPISLLIDVMEALPVNKAKAIARSIDWGAPEVCVLRTRSNAMFQYHSKLDILVEKASDRLVETVLDGAILDHVGEAVPDRRAQTQWGMEFNVNGLWASACIQALHGGRTDLARKFLDILPVSRGRSWMENMVAASAKGGWITTFAFLLSESFLGRFAIVRAPPEATEDEINQMREEVTCLIAQYAPMHKLKSLAGLMGGHLPAAIVAKVAAHEDKPHRAFALAKLIAMEDVPGGTGKHLPEATRRLLVEDLVDKSTSSRIFSPRATWLLGHCGDGVVHETVEALAAAGAFWDEAVVQAVRALQTVPGPVEVARLMLRSSDDTWHARLADALGSWGDEDFDQLRSHLEKTAADDLLPENMEPEVVAGRLAGVLGAGHACPRFERLLVLALQQTQDIEHAQAAISQAIMGQATVAAGAISVARRI